MGKAISIDEQTAQRIYSLYQNCESADAIYKSCQSPQFRTHMKSVYQAPNVERAFAELKRLLDENQKE